MVVGLFLDQLWCHVQRRALDGGHQQRGAGQRPRKPKVAQLHHPSGACAGQIGLNFAWTNANAMHAHGLCTLSGKYKGVCSGRQSGDAPMSTFWGFMSLWMMRLECR